jgi:potassium efflux system protein
MNLPFMRGVLVIVLAAIFCILPPLVKAATTESTGPKALSVPAPASPKAVPTAIPFADVATRATEVSSFLQTLKTKVIASSPEIDKILQQLPEVGDQIALESAATALMLEGPLTLVTLQTRQQLWERLRLKTSEWQKLLTERAGQLQEALDRMTGLQESWTKTRDAAVEGNAPGQILQTIQGTLEAIEAEKPALQSEHAGVLEIQNRIAKELERCTTALSDISQAQQRAMGGILKRDGLPIWSAKLWATPLASLLAGVHQSASVLMADVRHYFHPSSKGLLAQVGLFVLLVLLFRAARRQVVELSEAGEGKSPYSRVFDHPYAAALLVPLFLGSSAIWHAPSIIRRMFNILALVPMVQLTRQGAQFNLMRGIYVLGILFTVDSLRHALAGVPLLEQWLLLLEAISGMVFVGWSLAYGHFRRPHEQGNGTVRSEKVRAGAWLVLLTLAAGLIAGVFGYLLLARLLVSGLLACGVLALFLYCFLRVLIGWVALSLLVRPLRLLRMVQHHRAFLEHRIHRVLVWVAIGMWSVRSLDYVGLLEPFKTVAGVVLSAKLERGSLSISLGDVSAFVITVWASYLLSVFIRFVLREDVYPRTRIASGLSYAVSSLLNYLILTVGFVIGIVALGMDFAKLTVLFGAFGVGIGFGLQSVVNNFVSGLILLFERPIHVGDIIEVGDLVGDVRQIGIRSSKVRTRQGADIIVPNSQLVTEQVTNWTLADRLRRIDLPVGVDYGSSPQKVIGVLEKVALTHPNVLHHPPPLALLKDYGDSSINFELRAWTDQFDDWAKVRSDLAVALYDALKDAGMQFPFPQREVRLLQGTPDGAGEATSPVTGSPAMADGRAKGEVTRKDEAW